MNPQSSRVSTITAAQLAGRTTVWFFHFLVLLTLPATVVGADMGVENECQINDSWVNGYDESCTARYSKASYMEPPLFVWRSGVADGPEYLAEKVGSIYQVRRDANNNPVTVQYEAALDAASGIDSCPTNKHVLVARKVYQKVDASLDANQMVLALIDDRAAYTPCGNHSVVVERNLSGSFWLHEFGHARSLDHIDATIQETGYTNSVMLAVNSAT